MAHDIMSARFYQSRAEMGPAWHGIDYFRQNGLEMDGCRPTTITGILNLMAQHTGQVVIDRKPLFYLDLNGQQKVSDMTALVRRPTLDDPEELYFGAVSSDYEIMSPELLGAMLDETVNAPVETFAFLARGGDMFVCYVLPEMDIKTPTGKDNIRNYLVVQNPMNGRGSAGAYVTSVRTVCRNTLNAGISRATQAFRISHRPGLFKLMQRWIEDVYESTTMTIDVMREAYEVLARTPVTDQQVRWIASTVYPRPAKPKENTPRRRPYSDVVKEWEYRTEWIERARGKVFDFYQNVATNGAGEGIRGTAWAAWNGVTEFETFRRGTANSMAVNVIVGDRALNMRRAYNCAMALATGKVDSDVHEDQRVRVPVLR